MMADVGRWTKYKVCPREAAASQLFAPTRRARPRELATSTFGNNDKYIQWVYASLTLGTNMVSHTKDYSKPLQSTADKLARRLLLSKKDSSMSLPQTIISHQSKKF